MMTPERWRAVQAILQGALAREPAERDAFVAEACEGDEALQREVVSLLAAHDRAGEFLERPAAESLSAPAAPVDERLAQALAKGGRYKIERELARGGMATVYLARDLQHDRRVAIKVLREEVAAAVGAERFLEEIRLTASMQHPHILPLFDSGSADGLLWYVMPYIEGETLRERLKRDGRLPVDIALTFARDIADALEYAHHRGIVHRDVKPENVLLQSEAEGGHALVADFGIALALEKAGGDRLTRTGIMLGTPQYMAPEQATGDGTVDARTDVYALGAVLHEMIAGESPFAAASRQAVLQRVMHVAPVALATRRSDVSASIDAVVGRALAKRPDDRFPSAAAFSAALMMAATAPPAPVAEPTRERTSSSRGISARTALYAAAAMLVIGLAGGWALARSPAPDAVTNALAVPQALMPRDQWNAGGSDLSLDVVDRWGKPVGKIPAVRPWTPRISPDGLQVVYGAFGKGRSSSDLWVTDLKSGTTRRITDDDWDSNDPQWSADGKTVAYSVGASGGKDLWVRRSDGSEARGLAKVDGTQFPSDWKRDGSALLVTHDAGNSQDVLVQPADGSTPKPYVATRANESAARFSPDGKWVAYQSDVSGRTEVYIDSYAKPGRAVAISTGGGVHPIWRGDGRELYYWKDGELVAVKLGAASGDAPPKVEGESVLFRAPYHAQLNTMYDVSADGQRFVIVRQP